MVQDLQASCQPPSCALHFDMGQFRVLNLSVTLSLFVCLSPDCLSLSILSPISPLEPEDIFLRLWVQGYAV